MSVNINLTEQNVSQISGGTMINVYVSVKNICKKDYVWNSSTCSCKNGKYLSSHMDDDSIIISVEVIESYNEEIKTIAINANVSIFYKYSY